MSFNIKKISGDKEPFDRSKFSRSLSKAGASSSFINQLIKEIEENRHLRTTKKIYNYALDRLYRHKPAIASRYNIKQALLQLGPAGFPFEQFVAKIFQALGYATKTNVIIAGRCIDHEVDILLTEGNKQLMVECKYHNRQQLKSDVKVTLYIKASFDDVNEAWGHRQLHLHKGWIVTNTKFTSEAIKYGECAGINLLSWDYPQGKSLIELIHAYTLHPITTLVSLNKKEKQTFIAKGFVLCKDAPRYKTMLKELGIPPQKIKAIISEALEVCGK